VTNRSVRNVVTLQHTDSTGLSVIGEEEEWTQGVSFRGAVYQF